jgi:hypothetical protein
MKTVRDQEWAKRDTMRNLMILYLAKAASGEETNLGFLPVVLPQRF